MELLNKHGKVVMHIPDDVESLELDSLPAGVALEQLGKGLRSLRKLKTLRLGHEFSDLDPQRGSGIEVLRGLSQLEELGVASLPSGQDISPLATCTGLKVLRLLGLYKVDIAPLAALAGLQEMLLDGEIKNLKALGSLNALRSLELSENPRVSLKPLSGLIKLQRLGLRASKISDWQGLAAFPELKSLDIRGTRLESLEQLPGSAALEELWLDGCRKLRSLAGIERFPGLRVLWAQEMGPLVSLQPLSTLRLLQQLHLRDTRIEDGDLSPLMKMPSLRQVGLTRGPGMDLSGTAQRLPSCFFKIFGGDDVVEVQGTISILQDASSEPIIYRIDQDLTDLLGVETNDEAEELVERELSRRCPDLRCSVEFDSEGERFVARSTSLETLRAVGRIINELDA